MPTDIQKIYATAIQPLPDADKLLLASLILEQVAKKSGDEPAKPKRTGDITRFFGMFNSGDPDSADNERIDADLARAYADNHEDEG
jgi:hypothetical protein